MLAAEDVGAAVYNKYCTSCHGENGDANTSASRALNPMPRDFTRADFENSLTPERIIDAVRNGRPGTAMVGWQKRLSDKQIEAVSVYVRQRFAQPLQSKQCAICHSDNDRIERGKEIYQTRCYFCHGYDGRARTQAAQYLSPPPKNLHRAPRSSLALKQVIAEGRKGTAMMAFAKVLSEIEIDAVVSYITTTFLLSAQISTSARYHSSENGWLDGLHPLHDRPVGALSAGYLIKYGCVSCHQTENSVKTLVWHSQSDQ